MVKKGNLSKYFNEYFKYSMNDIKTLFNYYDSEKRKDLRKKFKSLIFNNDITKFKLLDLQMMENQLLYYIYVDYILILSI